MNRTVHREIGTSIAWNRFDSLSHPKLDDQHSLETSFASETMLHRLADHSGPRGAGGERAVEHMQ